MNEIRITIPVPPRTKKNSQRLISSGGRIIPLPSKAYAEYEQKCGWYLGAYKGAEINEPVNIKAVFYCERRQRVDLTNLLEALDDTLVRFGVLADDCRDVIAGHDGSRVFWDKENPRTEVIITKITDYTRWKEEK